MSTQVNNYPGHKAAAVITINAPGTMHEQGRTDVAAWMRKQADFFEQHGEEYTDGRFTAWYLYQEGV